MKKLGIFTLFFLITITVISYLVVYDNQLLTTCVQGQGLCIPPDILPLDEGFAKNSIVTVYINQNTGHFDETEFNCLKLAFTAWDTANQSNGTGIRFNVTHSPQVITILDTNNNEVLANPNFVNPVQVNKELPSGVLGNVTGGQVFLAGALGGVGGTIAAYIRINPGTSV